MKKNLILAICAAAFLFSGVDAEAKRTHVKSYNKKNGTHVSSHFRKVSSHKKHR